MPKRAGREQRLLLDPKSAKTWGGSDNLIRELTGQSDPKCKLSLQISCVSPTFSYVFTSTELRQPERAAKSLLNVVREQRVDVEHQG